ncbi:MAG: 3-phosphoglycerate dehydrogenase [Epulopiscium sp. Nele67-Bin004]|nr:MAG: 3-phosphoglycerate dehydrogenase [Epulopiscium sp. Nele67-Bin004]
MYNVLTLNEISAKGTDKLCASDFNVGNNVEAAQAVIVRSADMHSYDLNPELLGIARAGAGTNNIPIDKCTDEGIVVFNTPGANANAVKELVLTGMLLSSRKILEGIEWTKGLKGTEGIPANVESGKKQFIGPELRGKKLGVIGLGAIGVLIANSAVSLGMEVIGYDPFLSVQSAWNISAGVELAPNMDAVLVDSDFITIHVPFNKETKGMFNEELFAKVKTGCRLLNFSRGELVDTDALTKALENGTLYRYITDFPNEDMLNLDNVISIPHLGASTPESEENCAEMAALQLKDFLQFGIIKNSVNFPECDSPYCGKARITLAHKNVPKMVGSITNILADENLNIDNMVNKSKGDIAYTIVDLDTLGDKSEDILAKLNAIQGMIRVRLI